MIRDNENQEYWDCFEARFERTKEIMAGNPDYDKDAAACEAHRYASKWAGIRGFSDDPAPEGDGE